MEVQIRKLSEADLDQIMEIEPVAFGSHHWSRQSFINELNNSGGTYYSAVEPGSDIVYAYSGYWSIGDEAHITTLAVHPDYRRMGIGELMLINNIQSAIKADLKFMTLEVRVSNDPAQKLYYKYGFKSMGLRRKYYQDNSEDAMVLWTDKIRTVEFADLLKKCISEWEANSKHVRLDKPLSKMFENLSPKP